MIAKIIHGSEIHMYRGQSAINKLRKHCTEAFKDLKSKKPENINFFYTDADGDKICLNTEEDLQIMCDLNISSIKKIFLTYKQVNPESDEQIFEQLCEKEDKYGKQFEEKKIEEQSIKQIIDEEEGKQFKQFSFVRKNKNKTLKMSRFKKQDIIKKQVAYYMQEVSSKAIRNVQEEQNKIVQEEIDAYFEEMGKDFEKESVAANKKVKECKTVRIPAMRQRKSIQSIDKNQIERVQITKKVNEKIKEIMPELVKKTIKIASTKMMLEKCECQKQRNQKRRERSFSQ